MQRKKKLNFIISRIKNFDNIIKKNNYRQKT